MAEAPSSGTNESVPLPPNHAFFTGDDGSTAEILQKNPYYRRLEQLQRAQKRSCHLSCFTVYMLCMTTLALLTTCAMYIRSNPTYRFQYTVVNPLVLSASTTVVMNFRFFGTDYSDADRLTVSWTPGTTLYKQRDDNLNAVSWWKASDPTVTENTCGGIIANTARLFQIIACASTSLCLLCSVAIMLRKVPLLFYFKVVLLASSGIGFSSNLITAVLQLRVRFCLENQLSLLFNQDRHRSRYLYTATSASYGSLLSFVSGALIFNSFVCTCHWVLLRQCGPRENSDDVEKDIEELSLLVKDTTVRPQNFTPLGIAPLAGMRQPGESLADAIARESWVPGRENEGNNASKKISMVRK